MVIVAALDSIGGRLTLIEGHSGLTGGCTNNASLVETKVEKMGAEFKDKGSGRGGGIRTCDISPSPPQST